MCTDEQKKAEADMRRREGYLDARTLAGFTGRLDEDVNLYL
jgi:hypothetical protein